MKTFLTVILTLVALLPTAKSAEVKNPAAAIIGAIKTGQVERVNIWLADEDAEYHAAVTPKSIEKIGELVTVKNFKDHKATPLLLEALQAFEPPLQPAAEDYRFGIKFFNAEGKPIHSLYATAFWNDVLCDGQGAVVPSPFALAKIREWIQQVRSESKHP